MDYSFLIIMAIVFIGAMTQGLTGFGFALISVPLLSVFMDIKSAIPLGALCGLVINAVLFLKFKNDISFSEIRNLIFGAIIGIPAGVIFLRNAPSRILKLLLAFIILLFALFSIAGKIKPRGISRNWGYFYGILSGMLGGAFNTNGPPVLIYSYLQDWDKQKVKASLIGFFTFTSVVIVSSHALAGLITRGIMVQYLYLLPVIAVGIIAGNHLFARISAKTYNKVILYSLIGISLLLIFK